MTKNYEPLHSICSEGHWNIDCDKESIIVPSSAQSLHTIAVITEQLPAEKAADVTLMAFAKIMYEQIHFIANNLDGYNPESASMAEYAVWSCYKLLNMMDAVYSSLQDDSPAQDTKEELTF